MIPKDAQKPQDGRTRAARENKTVENKSDENACLPMPRKSPFLDMTDLYTVPGTADEVIDSLRDNPEAFARFKALHKGLSEGRMKLHNSLLSRSVSGGLSVRQRDVPPCRLRSFVCRDHGANERVGLARKKGALQRQEQNRCDEPPGAWRIRVKTQLFCL